MFKHYNIKEVASELSCKNFYSTVSFDFIVKAVKNAKNNLDYGVIYDSDIDVIDAYIRENLI